jgi:hypothetical protein
LAGCTPGSAAHRPRLLADALDTRTGAIAAGRGSDHWTALYEVIKPQRSPT